MSEERTFMRPSWKLDAEPPPKVKAAIRNMIKIPLEDIETTFSRFTWDYDKGNFHHWTELFLHFDEIFRKQVCSRKDLQLSDNYLNVDDPFPKGAVLQILRVMRIILENCQNKSSFNGLEHFTKLLASTDPDILIAALQALAAFVRINPSKLHVGGKLPGVTVLNHHLLSLSQGWGSNEEGLGLFSCVVDNGCDDLAYRLGSTLHFEFYANGNACFGENGESRQASGLQVIHIPELHFRSESDTVLLKQFVDQYQIPIELRFSLLTRIRYARAFRSLITRRQYVCIRLLAFMVLVQSNDVHEELVAFFANDPEFINEIIKVVQSEEIVPENIRTLAMLALASQLAAHSVSHEQTRILNVTTINTGGNRLLLLNLLQKSILSVASHTESCSVSLVEALLYFFRAHVMSFSSSGSAIRETGLVPALLSLLQDTNSSHIYLVSFAVKTLKKFMDYSNPAVILFRDLGGFDDMIGRLQIEVSRIVEASEESKAAIGLEDQIPYCQRRLIKALLKALGSRTYAPVNSSRPQGLEETALPASLSLIFHHAKRFGGDIFYSAVTLMNDIIHKDPTCFSNLHTAGLPIAFLDAVTYGLLPSSKALRCIPGGLDALCLNNIGLQAVKDRNALQFLVEVFTSRKYLLALSECVGPLAYAMEELLRHVPSLRGPCVDVLVEILEKIASIGGTNFANLEGLDSPVPMDTDPEDKHNEGHDARVQATGLMVDGGSNEHFIQRCIFHVMALMHRAMENAETCRLFVEKKGIEVLIRFLTLPDIPQSYEGMSHFVHIVAVFKAFNQQYSAPLAQAFCCCLRQHLKITFSQLNPVAGASLLVLENGKKRRVFQCLFVIQFFMFIADGLRENRWMTALLTEFGNDSKDVLHDIGRIHRDILWQFALSEDSKSEIEKDSGGSSCGFPRNSDATASEVDDHSLTSVGQYVNPILRQHRQLSGWNGESQLFDLIRLFHDFGHRTRPPWMLNMDYSSRVRLGVGHQVQVPHAYQGTPASKTESNKQQSYNSFCFEILKSLSVHITHLFLELGKVMLLPSRRQDDSLTVVPVAKSVASTLASIILDDLAYDGQTDGPQMELRLTTKCRYMGKVIDFIEGIIVDRQESCNSVLVNFFYAHGVLKSILTTFEATCQLLWTVMQTPPTLMETEDSKPISDHNDENDNAWIFGTLGSCAWLMDHLVTLACNMAPSTTQLLVQPVSTGTISIPRDPEIYVKWVQSQVLKVVLPVWNHPSFLNCNVDFVGSICSIMMHAYSGVDIKLSKVTGGSGGAQLLGRLPDESAIEVIVEMGFSRSRAVEALRQIGTSSIEMAMEWLFSHSEEVSEEDEELARALALSLGNTDVSAKDDKITNLKDTDQEEEKVQVPPVDEILSACIKLLKAKDSVAFPVRDLLVTICTDNEGQHRFSVISSIMEQLELNKIRFDSDNSLSSLSHILALILHEDSIACEVAATKGLASTALNILSNFDSRSVKAENLSVPKWVTATLLTLDCMLQMKPKFDFHPRTVGQSKRKEVGSGGNSVIVSEDNQHISLESASDMCAGFMTIEEKKRVIDIVCNLVQSHLPSTTAQAVLQLCARLTRVHAIAVHFLEAGGLVSLLRLPVSCLFSGFDSVAATIIRHILEDSQTLRQAMESEIRHNLVASLNRHTNGRVSPRSFLTDLAPVISRDPAVFMLAAQAVCQIEMVGGRPNVILSKEKDKDFEKHKYKEKDQITEKDRLAIGDNKSARGETNPAGNSGNETYKMSDLNAKNVKVHKRPPQSFSSVIEHLLDAIIEFSPPAKEDDLTGRVASTSSVIDMDVDEIASEKKGKAVMGKLNLGTTDMPEALAVLVKVTFILKLMTEILLMYPASINVLLRYDTESSQYRGTPRGESSVVGHGGLLYHVLHGLLPYPGDLRKEKKIDGDWRHKLSKKASQFLMAICVRAAEARRRLFAEITNALNSFVDSSDANGFRPTEYKMCAFIDLINDVLAARSPLGSNILAEVAMTLIDVGMVQALTRTLQILDLDHPDSPKVVNGIVKALESLTREQVHGLGKDGAPRDSGSNQDQAQSEGTHHEGSPNSETIIEPLRCEIVSGRLGSFHNGQVSGGFDAVTDDMERDRDTISCGFVPEVEEAFMHEVSEEVGGLEDGGTPSGMTFNVQHGAQDSLTDEDEEEDLSEDGRENEEGEEEDEDYLDEDEVHFSHPDTDMDDRDDLDFDEDDLDEDLEEEEEEDEEDEEEEEEEEEDENRLILRLEDDINVLDHFEVLHGADGHYPNDPFHVMPVELFGSTRRQGRTTSIYDLLGRTDDSRTAFQHPLLTGPPAALQSIGQRVTVTEASDRVFAERNLESILTPSLDSIFQTLRSGRPGNRLSSWADDNQQHRGANGATIAQAIEELFISQLQTPVSNQPSDLALNDIQSRAKVEANVLQVPEQGVGIEASLVNLGNDISETMECVPSHNEQPSDSSTSAVATDASEQDTVKERQTAIASDHGLNMQCECNDHGMLIAEAVSQDSSGSGATLGESHRSLEVEIGSADGHDDRGERQNSIERLPVRDIGLSRIPVLQRGPGMMGNHGQTDNSDPVQQTVNAVAEDVNQTACSGGLDDHQQNNTTTGSSSIDPTFLEALPEELRAEVLASQHNQVAQTANGQPLHSADIDPEFLAALPPDIQAEVLAQQRARRLHQSQEFEGQPVEMDSASIIATFPSDLREEVLLTSSDAVLANLTPALVAEANMLRERFAHRYHSRTLLGVFHRNRRNDSGSGVRTISSGFERVVGNVGICKSAVGGKLIEADGMLLVDTAALKALIQLLSLVQPLYKGPLQRLLLNLCAHSVTRATLVHILLNLLMPNAKKFCGNCSSCVQVSSYRLYGCQGHVIYSRPQFSDGVPPLVSRRVLETLTYLARNDPRVANLLLYFDMSVPHLPERLALDFGRGKAVMIDEECQLELSKERSKEGISIMLLLNLLTQPLYSRSTVHLEQVMNLLDVIMANAEIDSKSWTESQVLGSGLATATDGIMQEAELGNDISGSGSNVVSQTSAQGAELSNSEEDSKPSTSGTENKVDAATVLLGLPKKKLRLLCSLLARDGLSDNAYSHVVEVLKKLVIVAPLHCHLFITELADAAQRLSRSALSELQRYGDAEIMILSTTSIAGAAILRVLQALSSLAALFDDKEKDDKILSEQEHEDVMDLFLDLNTALEPLWQELSICIGKMESCSSAASILSTQSGVPVSGAAGIMSSLPPGTQNILPYIEAFFVTHERLQSDQSTSGQQELNSATACEVKEAARLSGSTSLLSSSVHQRKVDEKGITFMKFAERYRRLLNGFICQNPGLLEKSLSLMLKFPRLIDFDNKRAYFRSRIRHRHDHHPSPLRLSVRRAYILEDSYNQLRLRSTSDLKGRLAVHFQGEEGIDAGGLTREWYQLLSRVIFDKGALLFTTVGNESTFQPNPNSVYQTEHLSYFKFVGRVVAKALFDGQLLDVHFTRSFYKHILGVKVTYHDIEAIDPDFFKNLKWMLENDIGEVLDLTFSMDADEEKLILYERAEVTDYELIPGGRNLRVSEENKHEYVDLVAEHRLTTAIRPQINAFLEGFCDLIPKDLISIFNDKELELLISGLPEIDLDDLRANTEYAGYSAASSVIQWFWEVVQSFSKEEMARLLQFVTGTSKVPLEGFKALQGISGPQRFQVHKAYGSPDRLPSAHTCFNQLDLPEYPSKQQLQERLLLAIHEASEGFGFG